jgi:RNA polymerase sigma factor (sigma-70 family)
MSRSAVLTSVRRLRNLLAAQHDHEQSDEQLLAAFAERRDDLAFAGLVRRHGPMVLNTCRRVLGHEQDAEDAFQATFLVLARRAAALRHKSALAGFLHGTACHLASKIKRAAGRRRKHEGSLGALTQPRSPDDELLWREVRTLLDEEIARLPEKQRTAFVLCCLENLSQTEAARRLGRNERTLSSQLTAARKRLSQRLARRGVELTAVLAATAVATSPASAVPSALMATTIKAALATAAGAELASVVSASVAELAQGATAAMLGKAKMAAVLLLAVTTLAGASMWARLGWMTTAHTPSAQPADPPAAKTEDKPQAASRKPEMTKRVEIQGRVFGPDGKPKAGAKLLLLGAESIAKLGVTAADGRFTITIQKAAKGYLIAQADASGLDYFDLTLLKPRKAVELRLVKDHVIRGRVVTTEGKPVAGVRVGIRGIIDNTDKTLDKFLIGRKKQADAPGRLFGARYLWSAAAVLRAAVTDADGRFAVHGIGADRLVYLRMSGSGIAEEELWIINRHGFDPKPYNREYLGAPFGPPRRSRFDPRELGLLYGPDLSVVAEAEKPIRGVVKDADSGKSRPNVVVYLSSPGNAPIPVPLQAKTDTDGRYEIHGCRKAKSYTLEIVSDAEGGYPASQLRIADTVGYQPLRADIPIKKGTIISGKVIDRATGKSVPGFAQTDILRDNPFVKVYPRSNASALGQGNRVNTAPDGTFRIVTIPGPVLLMGGYYTPSTKEFDYIEFGKYRPPVADPEYPQYFAKLRASRRSDAVGYLAYPRGIGLIQGNFCKVLDIKPGTAKVHQDILLERASVLEAKIQDAEGRPVTGVWATDFTTVGFNGPLWIERSSCPVYGLEQRKPRLLIFYEPKKKIIGSRKLQGDEKAPIVVNLGAMGAIKGRLLDADGKPRAGVEIDVLYQESEAKKIHVVIPKAKEIVTDANGAFALDDVIPELKFQLSIGRGKRRFERITKPAETTIQVKPGETLDLGDVRVKPG